jgi:hypothetical protein
MRSPSARVRAPASGRLPHALIALSLLGSVFSAAPARAQSQSDASANDVADQVMDPDRLYSNFLVAEKRLAAALKKCGKNDCSKSVRARLLRDLGVVYIVGFRRLDKGKEYLTKAVKADPSIELDQRIATPELEQIFAEAGGGGQRARATESPPTKNEPAPEPAREPDAEPAQEPERESERTEPAPESSEPDASSSSDAATEDSSVIGGDASAPEEPEKPAEKAEPEPKVKRKGFVSITLQQDFLYYPGDSGVCDEGEDRYDCFDHRGTEYFGPLYEEEGNSVEGGLSRSTTRLMIGYDRRVSSNVLLGARLGYAFGGGPTPIEGSAFLPFHGELRAALFLGSRPFVRKGLRPNLSVGAGVAELTSHRSVEYWDSQQNFEDDAEAGTLDAWRRTGKVFFAPGFGVVIPAGSRGGVTVDLRGMFLFGKSATAIALAVGYALGI